MDDNHKLNNMKPLLLLIAIVSLHTASKIFQEPSTEIVPVPSEYHRTTQKGQLFESFKRDTTYKNKETVHIDPLLNREIRYYGK